MSERAIILVGAPPMALVDGVVCVDLDAVEGLVQLQMRPPVAWDFGVALLSANNTDPAALLPFEQVVAGNVSRPSHGEQYGFVELKLENGRTLQLRMDRQRVRAFRDGLDAALTEWR